MLEIQEKSLDVNEFLREALAKRADEIVEEKEKIAENLPQKSSRYVPARVREVLKKEFGKKRACPGCGKEAKVLDHTARFGMTRSHDPRFIVPLCAEHHLVAHSLDTKFLQKAGAG